MVSVLENWSDDVFLGVGCREWIIIDELVKFEI